MVWMFSEESKKELDDIINNHSNKQAACLSALHLAQKEKGYIDKDVIKTVAEIVNLSFSQVEGVVSFYSLYNRKKIGLYNIQVCTNISCSLCGGQFLSKYLQKNLNINPGETTVDGKFTLTEVECLAQCGNSPVIRINDTYHLNITKEKIDEIINKLRAED